MCVVSVTFLMVVFVGFAQMTVVYVGKMTTESKKRNTLMVKEVYLTSWSSRLLSMSGMIAMR